jgi:hypothetical protein
MLTPWLTVKDRALTEINCGFDSDPAIQFAWSCCIYSTMVKDRALTTCTTQCICDGEY